MGRSAHDIKGNRYGRLIALRRAENRGRTVFWVFKCDCGKEKEINKTSVLAGKCKSCGCYRSEYISEKNKNS